MQARIGRFPWGLLGMLVLVACGERFVSRHSLDFTRPEYRDWRDTGRAAKHKTRGRDLLIFGTSMTQQGLLPQVLGEGASGPAYNLSVCAGQAPASYFLLKRAIDAGARPKVVLVDFHPQFLASSYKQAASFWAELLEPAEALDLALEARDPTFFASTMTANTLPSVKDRLQIRLAILAALSGTSIHLRASSLTFAHNKRANDGALIAPRKPAYQGEVAPNFLQAFVPTQWSVDPVNARYVHKFMGLAERHGVEVRWVIPPLCPELQAMRNASPIVEPYSAFIRSVQKDHANLVVLDASRSKYPAGVFCDAAHLDGRGAVAWSLAVGEAIAEPRSGGKTASAWIDLATFREPNPMRPIVDLARSQDALRGKGAKRR